MAFNAAADAQVVRKAMKGLGTDEDALIQVLCRRSNEQIQAIRNEFQAQFNRDMIADIRSELGGKLESLIAGLAYSPGEYDAYILNKAIAGIGTDEAMLAEHLTHRTNEEMAAINAAYHKMFGKSLKDDLKGDLSGDMENLYKALINGERMDRGNLDADADALYMSGQGRLGTNERAFIDILTSCSQQYLEQLNVAYAKKRGNSILKAVESEIGGSFKDALVALVTPHDEYYAKLLHSCVAGMGTDEGRLVRLLVSRRAQLPGINREFLRLYQKTLSARLPDEFGGDLRKAVAVMLQGL